MASQLDAICPPTHGEQRIDLALSEETQKPRAFNELTITFDYTRCEPTGVVKPLELTIVTPSASNFIRKHFTRIRPSSFTFIPREGGPHVIRLIEIGHNRWWGALTVTVEGERTDPR